MMEYSAILIKAVELLIPAISGLTGVWLGGWLSFKRSTTEKLLELRRATYGAILSDMWEVERICDIVDEHVSQVGVETFFHSDASRKFNNMITIHVDAIRKRFTADYLNISDDFRSIYEAMNRTHSSGDAELPPDEHEHFANTVRQYRVLLLAQARKEMC
jgi:hypothetical protein